jgi:ABC-type dipeptide/oligopeptide/nickel transport system permease component
MCKYSTYILAVVAIIVGILSLTLSPEKTQVIVAVENFFGIMLPILAVGALFKYLFSCNKQSCNKDNGQCKK